MRRRTVGVISMIIGTLMLVYGGFNYVSNEKVIDLGPLKINKEKTHSIQWPPFIGVLLLAGGIAIVASDRK